MAPTNRLPRVAAFNQPHKEMLYRFHYMQANYVLTTALHDTGDHRSKTKQKHTFLETDNETLVMELDGALHARRKASRGLDYLPFDV